MNGILGLLEGDTMGVPKSGRLGISSKKLHVLISLSPPRRIIGTGCGRASEHELSLLFWVIGARLEPRGASTWLPVRLVAITRSLLRSGAV